MTCSDKYPSFTWFLICPKIHFAEKATRFGNRNGGRLRPILFRVSEKGVSTCKRQGNDTILGSFYSHFPMKRAQYMEKSMSMFLGYFLPVLGRFQVYFADNTLQNSQKPLKWLFLRLFPSLLGKKGRFGVTSSPWRSIWGHFALQPFYAYLEAKWSKTGSKNGGKTVQNRGGPF